jgi:hypothetical protein
MLQTTRQNEQSASEIHRKHPESVVHMRLAFLLPENNFVKSVTNIFD